MSAQINLYSTAFRRQRKPFSATWILAAFAAGVVLPSAWYVLASQPLTEMRARRVEAADQMKKIRDELVAAGKMAQQTSSKALEEEVARAEAQLKSRQELLGRIQGGEAGNREGYSKYLYALARQRVDGVWLTSIDIAGPANEFSVQGRAQRPGQISEYIKLLNKEEGFRGRSIGTLSLNEREIEVASEQGSTSGSASPSGAPTPQAPGAAGSRPRVRVLEFMIGTGVSAGTSTGASTAAGAASR